MKRIYLITIILLLAFNAFPSADPEEAEITIGIQSRIPESESLRFIRFICEERGFEIIENIDSVLQSTPLIVKDSSSERYSLDFLIVNLLESGNGEIRLIIAESGKPNNYSLKSKNNDELESKLLSMIDSYTPSYDVEYLKIVLNNKGYYAIAKAFYDKNRLDSSIVYLNKSISVQKNVDDSYYLLSLCYKTLGDKSKYAESLKKAIEANEDKGAFQIEWGNYLLNENKVHKAISYYKKQLQSNRYKDLAAWNIYVSYKRLGRDSLAYSYLGLINPDSKFYLRAQEELEIYKARELQASQRNFKWIFAVRLIAIGLVLFLVVRLLRKLRNGKTIGEQKFELTMLILGALIAFAVDLLKKII